MLCLVAQSCPIPWTVAHQAPLSMGFSRQEYWSGLPHPLQAIFPTQGSNPGLPHFRQILYRSLAIFGLLSMESQSRTRLKRLSSSSSSSHYETLILSITIVFAISTGIPNHRLPIFQGMEAFLVIFIVYFYSFIWPLWVLLHKILSCII